MSLPAGAPPVVLGDVRCHQPPQETAAAAASSTARRRGWGSPSSALSTSSSSASPRFVSRQLRLNKPGATAATAAAATANHAAPAVEPPPLPRVATLVPGHRQVVSAVHQPVHVDPSRISGSIVITEREREYFGDWGSFNTVTAAAATTHAAIAEAVAAAAAAAAAAASSHMSYSRSRRPPKPPVPKRVPNTPPTANIKKMTQQHTMQHMRCEGVRGGGGGGWVDSCCFVCPL